MLSTCRKIDLQALPIDESVWLQQKRGVVVYSDFKCNSFVVETFNGYSIVQNWFIGPYNGSVLYGDFSRWGIPDAYNRSRGAWMRVNVKDYWLNCYCSPSKV